MGRAALAGRPGIKEVLSGWSGFRETNTILYDPDIITVQEMIGILQKAKTYRGTADTR